MHSLGVAFSRAEASVTISTITLSSRRMCDHRYRLVADQEELAADAEAPALRKVRMLIPQMLHSTPPPPPPSPPPPPTPEKQIISRLRILCLALKQLLFSFDVDGGCGLLVVCSYQSRSSGARPPSSCATIRAARSLAAAARRRGGRTTQSVARRANGYLPPQKPLPRRPRRLGDSPPQKGHPAGGDPPRPTSSPP